MKKADNSNLLEAGDAVEDYLGSLLQEATETPPEQRPVALRDNVVLLADFDFDAVEQEPVVEEPVEVKPVEDKLVEAKPVSDVKVADTTLVEEQQAELAAQASDSGYEFPIQCLMFSVQGVALSIPLSDLSNVLPWPQEMTHIPSASDWSLGVVMHRDRAIKVVDSALLLDIRQPQSADMPRHQHILVIADSDWAVSCDVLGEVVNIQQADVQWQSERAGRMSQGTIRESLAQLLSVRKIIDHLRQQTII